MAYRVVWSTKAVADVEAIAAYIARDSPAYAAAMVQKLITISQTLEDDPLSGKLMTEFDDQMIREKSAYSHRIIYRINDNTVTVAAVIYDNSF